MPAFEARPGMPYWVDMSTKDLRKSTYFYSKVLGWKVGAHTDSTSAADAENHAENDAESDYIVARLEGLPVAGFIQQPQEASSTDTWVTQFLSADITADCGRVEELGGRVLSPATEVSLGQMALCADNADGLFGLIQPAGEDSFVAAGEPGTPVWHEYTATSHFDQVADFYRGLFNWETATQDGYSLVLEDGAAFAGLWDATDQFPNEVPGFWQSYLGVRDIDEASRLVTEFGGEVIRGPEQSSFGPLLLVSDATGATVTFCETPEPVPEEDLSEADSILNL
ncbi:VOC family protein [Corynebacterium cystitidis]|uniref:VOC family protein n=1 Tax=Corynebacterium cystitidis TaxID=35757 RepID=UPI00211EE10C|nr:VOC family protein [Corynebacterium cystitidis]